MLVLRRLAPCFLPFFGLLLLFAPGARAQTAPDGPAIIILDGSGSMWGNIGTERASKFDLARGALRQSLSDISPRVRLGLMSFGQRRRADCSDVEVLAAPEAGQPERILSIADKLNPKGKGPLALALREAAKQIQPGEAGSIIAIHDGMDNCAQDPCAVAADIAKANAKTRVFLISFGLEKPDVQRLACVAKSTNGKVIEARDSTSLAAGLSEALTLANLERIDPATGAAVPLPKAAPPPNPEGAPGLRLSASLASGSPPLAAPVHWTVAKADKPDAVLKSVKNRELSVDLDPGSYVVEARFGQASARQTLEVASDKPTAARLSLAAGLLKIKAHADKAGAPLTDPLVTISVKTADGSQRPFWVGRAADTEMVVPAGQYIVRVQDGLAEQTTEVTLTEGAGADVTPVLGTGRLELSAVAAANGQPLTDVIYLIEEDDPDARKGRREVARSADPAAAFTLPAGTYYVVARQGVAETRDRIALGTGDVVKHVATFSLVQLTVTANAGGGADQPVLIRILSEDQTHREIARANGMTGTFLLPPARYRVEATVSGLNIKALGTVDISNGRGGGVQLTLESGEVAVGASAAQGRHWRIKDASGRTVLHSGPGEATSARLAPGRYVLLTDGGERRTEQAFDLKTRERRELSLGSP